MNGPLGGSGVLLAELKITDAAVQSRKKVLNLGTDNWLPDGEDIIYGIGLLYIPTKTTTPELKLTVSNPVLKLENNKALMDLIQGSLIDLVVYAHHAGTDRCDIMEKLVPAFVLPVPLNYVLRQFNTEGGELSINRCTEEIMGFLPTRFQGCNSIDIYKAWVKDKVEGAFRKALDREIVKVWVKVWVKADQNVY